MGNLLDKILANPLVGLSPWIVYSLIEGQNRLELSAGIAFGVALTFLMLGWIRGSSPKLLDYADVVFFGAMAVVVAVATPDTHAWLELWGGEVANVALVAIATGSILVRRPFTLAYAKESAPKELWHNPVFLRTNYLITGVWALAFLIEAASGMYGDVVLHNSNNIWTGWIIQTLPLILAAQFTLWYPARVEALSDPDGGGAAAAPPVSEFLGHCTPWIGIVGVIVLAMDSGPTWLGVALIVVGGALTRALSPDGSGSRELTAVAIEPR